jgi:hypothetical protein
MDHVNSNQPATERRRSDRFFEPVPLVVRGIDLLGQPFEERTATLALNLHGCRYSSKYHLPKNTWVTLELPQAQNRPNVRARVAWVQRPHSIRDFFQVAVELEDPANIWGLDDLSEDWATAEGSSYNQEQVEPKPTFERHDDSVSLNNESFPGTSVDDRNELPNPPASAEFHSVNDPDVANSPLFRELRKEMERQSRETILQASRQVQEEVRRAAEESDHRRAAAVQEFFAQWKPEFEQAQSGAREEFSKQLAERQDEFLTGLKSEFEENFSQARKLMDDLQHQMEILRAENDAAHEAASRLAQARLQFEAMETARSARPADAGPRKEESAAKENVVEEWRAALAKEMEVARAQWNELLQSSLDNNVQRLVEQVTERSQDILSATESKIRERMAGASQPLAQAASEARESLAQIKTSLDHEVARARSSLSEIESVASRTKEYSAQLEAASHDTLNEIHRRLEKILEAQSAELNRRADNLAAGISQRVTPALDALQQEFVNRAHVQVEAKLAPHFERVPELLRELAAREVQAEESLRLHRERLRQASENNQREVSAQLAATLLEVRNDFESARKEALNRWNEELDASGVRAAHSASESIGRSSEWFQQEARARLQVLVEQTVTTASAGFDEKTAEAAKKYGAQLADESTSHLALVHQRIESLAVDAAGRARTEFDKAAEDAASSFGHVLQGIAGREAEQFMQTTNETVRGRTEDLERSAQQVLSQFGANAATSLEQLQAQMSSQVENSVRESRSALSTEFATALEGYRAERDLHLQNWASDLDRLSGEAIGTYQERLQTACDSWIVSSVRRLSEHGQNVIESMLRSADQALRDSCSKVFEGLAEILRERSANAAGAGVAGFAPPPPNRDVESSGPRNEMI